MEDLSRVVLYKFMIDDGVKILENIFDDNVRRELKNIYDVNLKIMTNIEDQFVFKYVENNEEHTENTDEVFDSILRRSLLDGNDDVLDKKLSDKLLKETSKKKGPSYKFNKLLNILNEYSNNRLDKLNINKYFTDKTLKNYGYKNKVFLSYAYEDRLYTMALFTYLYTKGIYLYIDWMHSGKILNGNKLKKKLHTELCSCSQLLLLRTVNMELNIRGNHYIRPWCAWEIGNFYYKEIGKEKYYIGLYEAHTKQNSIQMLEGIKRLNIIKNGVLS